MSSIALVDCNNFYVSCERVFNPKLLKKPVVILSSNDGCIVARSQEAKTLGIPMGAPFFQWADFCKARDVVVASSNYSLYGDFSHRVMQILALLNPDHEVYSIDEAFLLLEGIQNPLAHSRMIRNRVLQWTGIPVSIGIAKTKTLAKIANHQAKRNPSFEGVFMPDPHHLETILKSLPTGEIWGIGRRLALFLAKHGIHSAFQLREKDDDWVRKNLSVVGLRTVWELRGRPCFSLNEMPSPKKSIMTSRSFGRPILSKQELSEALASFTVRGAEKLREEGRVASWLQPFIMTSPHHEETYYSNQAHIILPEPTAYTPTLLNYAQQGLSKIYRPGYSYKKAGILLGGLVEEKTYQQDLFAKRNPEKEEALMTFLDQANEKFGYQILRFAAEGTSQPWKTKKEKRSPCYTTQWEELMTIHI